MPESARGEHEAEGRAVEAHQEAKHAARVRPFTLDEAEAADLLDLLADCAELADQTGRPWLAENVRAVLRLLNKRGEEVLSG